MNKLKLIVLSILISVAGVNAQTNSNVINTNTPVEKGQSYEITFGGAGSNINGQNEVGADFSLSTNPFKDLPNLWVGVAQEVYWTPSVGGSTDVNLNWSTHLYKELYINTGWSAGLEYSQNNVNLRTGPEVTFEYYVGENAFIYSGVNYDIGQDYSGFRYSFGLGITF